MKSDQITVVAELMAKDSMAESLKEAALELVEPSRQEQGCINYDFHQDTENPNHFLFYENWASQKDLDEHASKPHFKQFAEKSKDMLADEMKVAIFKKLC